MNESGFQTATLNEMDEEELAVLESIESELVRVDRDITRLQHERRELVQRKQSIVEQQEWRKNKEHREKNWEAEDFPWSPKMRTTLKKDFGLTSFRPLQRSAINILLSKLDVFLVMPTGGGKSLCYQLPALMPDKGLTLVVSPLVALMEDQVMGLKKIGVNAEKLNADTPRAEVTRIMNDMTDPRSGLRLLYVTPEKLAKSKRFMNKLQACHKAGLFAHLAIDEVHCCSHWGHDFRPDYKFLGVMKSLFPEVPFIGLTATSTAQVTEDCKSMLNMKQCVVLRAPFNRPNLFYEVRPKPDTHEESVDEIAKILTDEFKGQSGIIYSLTIKDVEKLTQDLKAKGIKVAPYHAQLEAKSRLKVHQRWVSGDYQAVVATIAFGMGIDKPDVRFVIHHSISKSMENFYQESGRAGRDDKPARCITFFKFADIFRISTMVFTEQTGLEKLYKMVSYCSDMKSCRRELIADQFGESWDHSDCKEMCDNCKNTPELSEVDILPHARAVRNILKRAADQDLKLTSLKLVNSLLGKGESKLRDPDWSPPDQLDKTEAENVIKHLLLEQYVKEDFAFTPYATISYVLTTKRSLPTSKLHMQVKTSRKRKVLENGKPKLLKSKKKPKNENENASDFIEIEDE